MHLPGLASGAVKLVSQLRALLVRWLLSFCKYVVFREHIESQNAL